MPAKDFSAAWPENAVFPSARSLRIGLSILHYQEFDKHSTTNKDERFHWITERIQTSMPQLQEVALDDQKLANTYYFRYVDHQWKADKFLVAVFNKAKSFEVNLRVINLTSDHLVVQNGTGLTNLKCAFTGKCEIFSYIVDKSAATLESLFVKDFYFENVRSLIFNDMDTLIVYPQLQKFTFYGGGSSIAFEKICVDESLAPFPVLRYLHWSSSYIFEDDTLFRGNSDTLEDLDISTDVNLADVQQRYKIFSAGKYLRLRRVLLNDAHYYSSTVLSPELFIRFAATLITPATRCAPYKIDDGDAISQDSPYINDLYSMYYPLSNNLTYWTALSGYSQYIDTTAKAALILAMLCLSFAMGIPNSSISLTIAKLTGYSEKIHRNTMYIKNMFNSALGMSWYEDAAIKPVSGIHAQVKEVAGNTDMFRVTFENKVKISDIVFLRAFYKTLNRFYILDTSWFILDIFS
ncbi:Glycoside hydrolase 2 (Mannanase, beta-galactosidase) [Coemansia sp. RSA 986]|nr:Glycoside hydrolase 2 (Mannanase, beta-galactosidase) [Coemansia sp. RSA 986]